MRNISHRWIGLIALLLAFWPTWRWYIGRLTDQSDEPLGVFALAAAAFLIIRERASLSPSLTEQRLALISLLIYAATYHFVPPLISGGIAMVAITAYAGVFSRHPGIAALFVLSLPIEASLQFFLGYPLRRIATEFSVGLLKIIGLPVQSAATQILDGEKVVSVAPACAGIQMLWLTLTLCCFLAGWNRSQWRKFLILIPTAIGLVLITNGLRITALFFKETERISLPDWTHEAIGLIAFTLLLPLILKMTSGAASKITPDPPGKPLPLRPFLIATAITAGIAMFTPGLSKAEIPATTQWPTQWEGQWLEPMPLTRHELQFASNFPGSIAAFEAGDTRVILRYVTRPTRKLHPSQDCFRASGFAISGESAEEYTISHQGDRFTVKESIHEDSINSEAGWHHPSEWFWDAFFGKSKGPWIAVTSVQPDL